MYHNHTASPSVMDLQVISKWFTIMKKYIGSKNVHHLKMDILSWTPTYVGLRVMASKRK